MTGIGGSQPSPTPPPGWYPEGATLRWWDGAAWGPVAPPPAWPNPWPTGPGGLLQREEDRGKTTATVSHLGVVLGGFILPLIVYLMEKDKPDRNRFVCHHASEALNFQLTFLAAWMVAMIGYVASIFATIGVGGSGADVGMPWGVFAFFPLLFGMMAAHFVIAILAMVHTSRGEWYRYPVSVRLVARNLDWRTA